jgi:hypothetical protein
MQEQVYKQYCIALSSRGHFIPLSDNTLLGDCFPGGDGTWYLTHGSMNIPFVLKKLQLMTLS